LHVPEKRQQPQIPHVVKAYLDALEGLAYDDDRQVSHLVVSRYSLDHPMVEDLLRTGLPDPRTHAAVGIRVMPIERYSELFERAFRLSFWRRQDSPWWPTWSLRDELKLIEERRRSDTAGSAGSELVRSLEERRLCDGPLTDIDRPGDLPRGTRALHRVLPGHRIHWYFRQRRGEVLLLDLPGQTEGSSQIWRRTTIERLRDFGRRTAAVPFGGFVALDIAVRGQSLMGKDLDNLAHAVLVLFEEELCRGRRGTVVAYRVYEAVGGPLGVQVRVVDSGRLQLLAAQLIDASLRETRLERFQSGLESMQAALDAKRSAMRKP
jgi:hypothetical protein